MLRFKKLLKHPWVYFFSGSGNGFGDSWGNGWGNGPGDTISGKGWSEPIAYLIKEYKCL